MKEIKPDFYDKFQCTADQCTITCCQEWKIAVDDKTNKKWKTTQPPSEVLPRKKNLCAYTTYKDNVRVIGLNREHRCPFLNDEKLCKLVLTYGDEMLSETCQIFPREIHEFQTRKEYALMTGCPTVVDLLNEAERFQTLEFSVKSDKEEQSLTLEHASESSEHFWDENKDSEEQFLFEIRDFFCKIAAQKENSTEKNLLMIFYLAGELERQEHLSKNIQDNYFNEKTLAELSKAIEDMQLDIADTFIERNELFLDLAVNYRKEGLYEKYLDEIAKFAETLAENYDTVNIEEKSKAFQQEMDQYSQLLKKFIVGEIYAGCLMPEGDFSSMVVELQWIAIEYAVVNQAIFLYWLQHGSISYEVVRNYLVVISRMTGYDEADIYEYLENSFEELIWDWGYFALVIGK